MITNLANYVKRYLRWAQFELSNEFASYKWRLWIDIIFNALYTGTSIFFIFKQRSDVVVLALNLICLFRELIDTTIRASEITKIKRAHIKSRYRVEVNSHYHIKAIILGAMGFLAFSILGILMSEDIADTSIVTKIFASITILSVFFSNCENNAVTAYNAYVR